ncbi:MAG TPA: inositol 2-dehydrogenase [Phenylobacterium sp.]|jgi:myo-inositol 2-dehydrogenase/D-chiro-inositol 1-dehydrogenase|uniref:inositol 2-dehydrogenase n=1 Tax=Phenylobacterium sp. TaxID=1871053 RepID=UPI002D3D6E80|nr:inositol 2-dehydrogenase [Phenylobacterium sp.]HZZ67678.1 inositol 2-dehydrogenase [Phenylobacterium sp.]
MFKIALIGAGRIGKIHAANAVAHPALTLSHVVDPVAANAQALSAETGAQVTTLDAVLADPDVAGVIVASATDAHLDHCLAAHAAGKAIFCEKPLDMDLARAAGAALKGARLFLGFNRRFDPNFQALKARLADGSVGALESLQITSNDPRPPPIAYVKVSGGLFKDMAIHDFDMARWLLGEEPVEVFAWGSCLVDPAIGQAGDIDTARTVLKTASGKLCVIANSRRSGFGYDQRIEAYGSAGLVRADNVLESTVQVWGEAGAQADRFQNFFLDRYAAAYRAEMAHFADMLAGKTQASVGYADGVAALALAEAAAQSLRTGQPVRL